MLVPVVSFWWCWRLDRRTGITKSVLIKFISSVFMILNDQLHCQWFPSVASHWGNECHELLFDNSPGGYTKIE